MLPNLWNALAIKRQAPTLPSASDHYYRILSAQDGNLLRVTCQAWFEPHSAMLQAAIVPRTRHIS
jgi:hypothetical protein